MGGGAIRPRVLEYLNQHRGELLGRERMGTDLELRPSQVRDVMGALVHDLKLPGLAVVSAGNAWRYAPDGDMAERVARTLIPQRTPEQHRRRRTPGNVGDMFEVVGRNDAGDPVVRSEDGRLYRVVPV